MADFDWVVQRFVVPGFLLSYGIATFVYIHNNILIRQTEFFLHVNVRVQCLDCVFLVIS